MERHFNGHCHRHCKRDDSADDVDRVVALFDAAEVRVGRRWGSGRRGGCIGPHRGMVVVADVLVQSSSAVRTAKPIMAGAAAVDEVILGAVKGDVILPHDIIITDTHPLPPVCEEAELPAPLRKGPSVQQSLHSLAALSEAAA